MTEEKTKEKKMKINYLSKCEMMTHLMRCFKLFQTIVYHHLCARRETCSFSYAKTFLIRWNILRLVKTQSESKTSKSIAQCKSNRSTVMWNFAKIHENLSTNITTKDIVHFIHHSTCWACTMYIVHIFRATRQTARENFVQSYDLIALRLQMTQYFCNEYYIFCVAYNQKKSSG